MKHTEPESHARDANCAGGVYTYTFDGPSRVPDEPPPETSGICAAEELRVVEGEITSLVDLLRDMNSVVDEQTYRINFVRANTEVASAQAAEGHAHLLRAVRDKRALAAVLAGALGGMFIGGPLGSLVVAKTSAASAGMIGIGGLLGGCVARWADRRLVARVAGADDEAVGCDNDDDDESRSYRVVQ